MRARTCRVKRRFRSWRREGTHVLAPDLPSHGDSDSFLLGEDAVETASQGMGPSQIASTVAPLLDQFGMQRVALVGASLGGLTSIHFTQAHPDRAASIALIDVGHKLEPEGVRKIVDFMTAHESFATLEEAAAAISEYLPNRKAVRPSEHPANNLDQFMSGVKEAAESIECPVLVLRGDASDVLSQQGAEEVASLMRNATLATVEKAGHLAAGDNPKSTSRLIASFLDEQRW